MTTLFLAGASGAIGRRLAPLLVQAGHRVVGTTRRPQKASMLEALGVEPIVLDVYDANALRKAVVAAEPEIVLHQLTDLPAAMKTADMASALARNARLRDGGTANLVAAAAAAGARRMIAQSLAFAYAPGPLPHAESAPINPSATGVLSLERQVDEGPFDSVILRYGRLWGPGTGFDAPQPGGCGVHVDAAAYAATLAIEAGDGPYNIAEETGEVATARARTELGWSPDFRFRNG